MSRRLLDQDLWQFRPFISGIALFQLRQLIPNFTIEDLFCYPPPICIYHLYSSLLLLSTSHLFLYTVFIISPSFFTLFPRNTPTLPRPLRIDMRLPFQKRLSVLIPHPLSAQPDIEKNQTASSVQDSQMPPHLLKFQQLVGICSPNVMRASPAVARPAPNEGVYKRTIDAESKVKLQYVLSNYMVNTFYMLQIIVGAALTALGAAKGPASAVTFLGAINTVIAGLLTYMKGQGLPMRLEQNLHLLRTLREHIESREREFFEPDCTLDVDEEVERVTRMYQEVRQTAQDNAPGTVLPPRGSITSLLKKPDINRSDVPAPRGDKTAGQMLKTGLQDLATLRHHVSDSVAEEKETHFKDAKAGVKDLEREMERLGGVAKDTMRRISEDHLHEGHLPEKPETGGHGTS